MVPIEDQIVKFLGKRSTVIVATANSEGVINLAAKGIAKVDSQGIIYIIDLYDGTTRSNLSFNSQITISAVDEELFQGWQFKGTAKEHDSKETEEILAHWDKKITGRIADRIIHHLQKGRAMTPHSERHLPNPEYIIEMTVDTIVSLAPGRKK